jgi:hypothetical protein
MRSAKEKIIISVRKAFQWHFFAPFYHNGKLNLQLKGQSHEKVGEMRVQGDSLGSN